MKKPAEKEIKNLIRQMRQTCARLDDCPVGKARSPSQMDCISCILQDVEVMRQELQQLRQFKAQVTMYGTSLTKLEATLDPQLLPVLKSQMARQNNGTG